ncbi:MAG: PadR family transcriptional regulator [Gemmatimonadota bacterium]
MGSLMSETDGQELGAERYLPLKNQWFHILTALSQEPGHGSGIVRNVLEQTQGNVRLWPATLYGSLEELTRLGWIEELTEDGDFPEGESRRKRIYRLTPRGAEILGAEARRMSRLARTALANLGSQAPAP